MWEQRRLFRVYAATFALVAAAFMVHYTLRPWLGDHLVFLFFLPATLVSAWIGGLGPGLVSLALGFLLGDFFFLPPRFDFVVRGATEFLSLVIYFFCGLFGVAAIDRFRRAKDQLNVSETHRQALKCEIEERLRVEHNLRVSEQNLQQTQEELRKHAELLEQSVAERTAGMRQSLESLENVVYHVAHDLRAPVRAMHSFSELLHQQYGSRLDEPGEDYALRIQQACLKMDRLTSDLLQYGRLGYREISLHQVNLATLVTSVLRDLEPKIKQRHAKIQLNEPLPKVVADTATLEQVVMNLLSNALKFAKPGTDPQVRIWSEVVDDSARVHVKDEGIGIESKYHERIFGIFQRLHDNQAYPGTGIGLAIVKKGMERMGGRVGVASEPEHGSDFWLELKRVSP